MDSQMLEDIERRFDSLSQEDKLWLLERLVRRLRLVPMDSAKVEKDLCQMANDPEIQRELSAWRGV